MKTEQDKIIEHMMDVMPFKLIPQIIPYLKECMDIYADQQVAIAVVKRDADMRSLDSELQHIANTILCFDHSTKYEEGQLWVIQSVQQRINQILSTPTVEQTEPTKSDHAIKVSELEEFIEDETMLSSAIDSKGYNEALRDLKKFINSKTNKP